MRRILLIGNSGSGKSTLAARLSRSAGLPHLDLDVLAWQPVRPPVRRALESSARELAAFMAASGTRDDAPPASESTGRWVIEGCYADLAQLALAHCTQLVFLNPGVAACQDNARARLWEPHKDATAAEQHANLAFLLSWIAEYETRQDEFSLAAHRALFDRFVGDKRELTTRAEIAAFG